MDDDPVCHLISPDNEIMGAFVQRRWNAASIVYDYSSTCFYGWWLVYCSDGVAGSAVHTRGLGPHICVFAQLFLAPSRSSHTITTNHFRPPSRAKDLLLFTTFVLRNESSIRPEATQQLRSQHLRTR